METLGAEYYNDGFYDEYGHLSSSGLYDGYSPDYPLYTEINTDYATSVGAAYFDDSY